MKDTIVLAIVEKWEAEAYKLNSYPVVDEDAPTVNAKIKTLTKCAVTLRSLIELLGDEED